MRMFLLALSTVLVGCAVEYVQPEADTSVSFVERITKGGHGWAKIQDSWNAALGQCTFCEAIPAGSVQTMEMGGCVFQMRVDQCTCVGDDPGENTTGLLPGCYCEGTVTQIYSNPNGACFDANLLPGGGVLTGN